MGPAPVSWLPALLAVTILTACGGGNGGSSAGRDASTSSTTTARQLLPASATEVRGIVGQSVPAVPAVRLVDGNGIAAVSEWAMGSNAEGNRVVAVAADIGEVTFLADPAGQTAARFSIDGVHLNQASQTPEGEIDAAAGRAALLRVVVRASEENTAAPAVRVRLFHDDRLVREELLPAPAAGVPVNPDLAIAEDSAAAARFACHP